MKVCGESEGLDLIPTLGGELHWLIAPFDPGCTLTSGPRARCCTSCGARAGRACKVKVLEVKAETLPGRVRGEGAGDAARRAGSPGARVSFAGAAGRTGRRGTARRAASTCPGRFKALARKDGRYGLSGLWTSGSRR